MPTYNPDYVPTGLNNRVNPYYRTINHSRLARIESNRTEFFGAVTPHDPAALPSKAWTTHAAADAWLAAYLAAHPGNEMPDDWQVMTLAEKFALARLIVAGDA